VAASPDTALFLRVDGGRGFAVTAIDVHGVEHPRPDVPGSAVSVVDVPESGHLRLVAIDPAAG
jgi:hypothetical protein